VNRRVGDSHARGDAATHRHRDQKDKNSEHDALTSRRLRLGRAPAGSPIAAIEPLLDLAFSARAL